MRPWQRLLRGVCGLSLLIGTVLIVAPAHVSATTGPTIELPASRYKVAMAIANRIAGTYTLKSVARSSRLYGVNLGIEVDLKGYLYGYAQFDGYDLEGYRSLWINVLYNFHQLPKGVMSIDVLDQGGSPQVGRMLLTQAKNGDLTGQLLLQMGSWSISFKKTGTDWSPAAD
jgi:hypothetical protein